MAQAEKNCGMNLSAGLHSFPALRKADALYFDKTAMVRELLGGGRHYFLSRPAGFGKTLLLTMLRSFFSGEAQAFRGLDLEAEAMRNASAGYEVIFADLEMSTGEAKEALERICGLKNRDWPVVLLVDGFMPDEANTEAIMSLMKAQSRLQHILDFVLITGRTPLSTITDNPESFGLLDISANPAQATLCGFTHKEIKQIPAHMLRTLAKRESLNITETRELLQERACCFQAAPDAPVVYSPADILSTIARGSFAAAEDTGSEPFTMSPPDISLLEAMKEDLEEGRPDDFMVKLRAVFSSVAYGAVPLVEAERHFQAYTFLIVRLLGFPESEMERLTSAGRIDMRVATSRFIYIFEFKANGSAASALSQIRSRGYLHADQSDPRPVWLIGANYSKSRRSIADWKIAPGRKVR